VPEVKRPNIKDLQIRAKLPLIFRALVLLALIVAVGFIGVNFYRERSKPDFVLKSLPTNLSKDVTAVVEGYERKEMEGDLPKYYIKADKATTFSDNHQELENIYLEAYDETGEKFDKISANKAIYIPAENKNFTAYFTGSVEIETRNNLKIKTEQLNYDKELEIAESEELIEFSRDNLFGKSVGARVYIKDKKLELLKDVELTANDEGNIKFAQIKSGKAVIEQATETATFEQNVNAEVSQKDAETVHTHAEKIVAHFQNKEISKLEMSENVEVSQKPANIHAKYATAFFTNKQLQKVDLKENVEIVKDENGERSKINAGSATAFFENGLKKVDLDENVTLENTANGKWTKASGNKATAFFNKELQRAELDGNVEIDSKNGNDSPTKIRSQIAIYDKSADKFELKNGVEIRTTQDDKATVIHANNATYEQGNGKVFLNGNAEILQGNDIVKGDSLNAILDGNKKLRTANVRGNGYLKQVTDRTTEVYANEFDATFDANQKVSLANARGNVRTNAVNAENNVTLNSSDSLTLNFVNGIVQKMVANGNSNVTVVPTQPKEYTQLTLSAPRAINVFFANGNVSQMQTEGRTTINLKAPNNSADSANKKLTADSIKTQLAANGKDLTKAEAIGNAELTVEPLRALATNYNTKVNANRFDCDFYEGNNAKNCNAIGKTKTVRVPLVPDDTKGTQTLWAERVNASFNKNSQDIQQLDAVGNAKFTELDRTGTASQITYTANDEIVRLRGGDPTVFDSAARARANEIDWDTRNEKSYLRGKVGTTYYSQKTTKGSTPFAKTNSPVYITAENAEFNHREEVGVYLGNARAWQDNNFVKSDKLIVNQKAQRFDAEGNVQSMLYDAKQKGKSVPAFVTANQMIYTDGNKALRYVGKVDMKQGTDRLNAEIADVYLNEKNEIRQAILTNNVVITQPNRIAKGDFLQYNAMEETAILRGNPAFVKDETQGSSESSELFVSMKDNNVNIKAESKTTTNNGRIRTVYKIKKP
jgi:lipopolysaccharide export system protein LptA